MMKINEKYEKIKKLCSDELSETEKIMISVLGLREELLNPVIKFLKSPSKRIRPLLSILYMKASGFDLCEEQLKILAAVELVHNASLIHDDIIDESNIRRGEKTVSCQFGNKLGVISGDYILSEAMNLLCTLNSVRIINQFTNTLQKMCIGEVNQYFDSFKIGTIEQYIEKSKNKTGYLFQTAVSSPLIYSGESDDIISAASDFGLNFGIAFQIRDDILNITSSDKSKPAKNDIEAGVYTAPVIYANDTKQYLSGVEKAGCLLNNYINKAEEIISDLKSNTYTLALGELLELFKYE